MTFQQICKDVHMVKTNGQQVFIESRNRPLPRKTTGTGNRKETVGWRRMQNSWWWLTEGKTWISVPLHLCLGAAVARTTNSDPIRDLIADLTRPPNSLVPAALLQKEPSTSYSYQQINCLESIIRLVQTLKARFYSSSHNGIVIYYLCSIITLPVFVPPRYLESCNTPNTMKRKCGSSSCTASSTSDDDKQPDVNIKGNQILTSSTYYLKVTGSRIHICTHSPKQKCDLVSWLCTCPLSY